MIPRYRAWNKATKEMHEVDDIMSIDFGKSEICVKTLFFGKFSYYDLDDIVFMQSTGLTDKNGKEIFEGDILKFIDEWEEYCHEGYIDGSTSGINYVGIETDSTCFTFGKTRIYDSSLFYYLYDEHLTFQELITDNELEFEAVGNIYENPELLEEGS